MNNCCEQLLKMVYFFYQERKIRLKKLSVTGEFQWKEQIKNLRVRNYLIQTHTEYLNSVYNILSKSDSLSLVTTHH